MSHRRRFLNLIMENRVNDVYSLLLRRIDLHSCQNSLFYPTAAAAEAAAAARDPKALFSVNRSNMAKAANKLKKIRLSTSGGTMTFQPTKYNSSLVCFHRMYCAGLSESRTLFMDPHSCGAFLYDADERRVVTLPNLRARKQWFPVFLSAAGDGVREQDRVYIMERTVEPDGLQFEALRRRDPQFGYSQSWGYDELPPPPFNDDVGRVGSYALVTTGAGASSSDVICVSSKRVGTYCLHTASRTWSKKAGDRALPFAGNVEHDAGLDVWVGFLDNYRLNTICASSGDLFSAADGSHHTTRWELLWSGDPCEALEPPYDHVFPDRNEINRVPRIVGLGSGKFCAVQFFKTVRGTCSCGHREGEGDFDADRFAVFTGVEVTRRGGSDDEQDGNGCSTGNGREAGELRIVFHKSKRYMLPPTFKYPDVRYIL